MVILRLANAKTCRCFLKLDSSNPSSQMTPLCNNTSSNPNTISCPHTKNTAGYQDPKCRNTSYLDPENTTTHLQSSRAQEIRIVHHTMTTEEENAETRLIDVQVKELWPIVIRHWILSWECYKTIRHSRSNSAQEPEKTPMLRQPNDCRAQSTIRQVCRWKSLAPGIQDIGTCLGSTEEIFKE